MKSEGYIIVLFNYPFSVPILKVQAKNTKRWANANEQYSRRSHLRVRGLKLTKDETCNETVKICINNILSVRDSHGNRVHVTTDDIDAAHPLIVIIC